MLGIRYKFRVYIHNIFRQFVHSSENFMSSQKQYFEPAELTKNLFPLAENNQT